MTMTKTFRIIHIGTLTFVQGNWDTRNEAGKAKLMMSEYDFDFLGDNDYRIVEVAEVANPLLNHREVKK